VTSGFVPVTGGRLWFEEAGRGPAVVLSHSGLLDGRQWDRQMESVAERYRVVRYDVRGFGRSDRPTAAYNLAEDLVSMLDALEVERAALVGNSMGGSLSIDTAVAFPERVWALVPVASGLSGFDDWGDDMDTFDAGVAAAVATGDVDRAIDLYLEGYGRAGGDPDGDRRIRQLMVDNADALTRDRNLEWPLRPAAAERLEAVAVPTLAVLGERDFEAMERVADLLVAKVHGARKVVIPGTDHFVNLRDPAAFDREVLRFLDHARP
jgi:pimeloyl-ACP methyl ester carboxylesterase